MTWYGAEAEICVQIQTPIFDNLLGMGYDEVKDRQQKSKNNTEQRGYVQL